MATNFPSSVDSFTNPTTSDTLASVSHSAQHSDVNDAVEALEAKVGVDSSTVSSSLDYRVAALEQTSGRRNFLYNGAMQVWQRSTSGTTTGADNYKTMDRWRNRVGTIGQSATYSRQSAGLTGFQYCARIQRPSGGTDTGRINLIQSLETVDVIPMAGRTVTLSFYARKGANFSGASDNMLAYLVTGTGTDVYWATLASTGNPIINGTTSTLTSSWQRFTITASVPSNAESLFLDLSYDPTGTAGVDDYFEITGVQLELGDKATPFEHRSFGEELALCQRYYFKPPEHYYSTLAYGVLIDANTFLRASMSIPVTMRATPSVTYSSYLVYGEGAGRSGSGTIYVYGQNAGILVLGFGHTGTSPGGGDIGAITAPSGFEVNAEL